MARISIERFWTIGILTAFLLGTIVPVGAGAAERYVLDGLRTSRRQSGLEELQYRRDLDEIARKHAAEIARRPHSRRLASDESIEEILRQSGVEDFRRAVLHVDLKRGYRYPEIAFLTGWKGYESAWHHAMSETMNSVGLAVHSCDDGWIVMVAILLDEIEPVRFAAAELHAMERETVAAVNDLRRSQGLGELVRDPALERAARAHSEDMSLRGYFAHGSPEGRDVDFRVRSEGLTYHRLGENLHKSRGAERPVQTAVESWMGSRRHRETMLAPDYTRTAVGVAVSEDGELYFTQLFLTQADSSPVRPE